MTKPTKFCDVECYVNFFLIMFEDLDTKEARYFVMYPGMPLNTRGVAQMMERNRIITFNGISYDMFMIQAAIQGYTCEQLKALSDSIIVGRLKPWQTRDLHKIKMPWGWDHIDMFDPPPGVQLSLKKYGARVHSKQLQDLPIHPGARINEQQRDVLIRYCRNDLRTLRDLWNECTKPGKNIIEIREEIGKRYDIDLRSKSDAQMAEAVIRKLVEKRTGNKLQKARIPSGTTYRYTPPAFIKFKSPELNALLQEIRDASFVVLDSGKVGVPTCLQRKFPFGMGLYTLGLGGIHSNEKSTTVVADADHYIRDIDATSFYPYLISICGLSPENMGKVFQEIYGDWIKTRVKAKEDGLETLAQTLKIFLNGIFGKLGDPTSILFAPNLLIQVTITGQLVQLMAIEAFELNAIPVVSANTDGIVVRCRRDMEATQRAIVKDWERRTGFKTEETDYLWLCSRDINTYLALKLDGKSKAKGDLAPSGLAHDPTNWVCREAVVEFLTKGTPIAETIYRCKDITKFISAQQVKGGAFLEGDTPDDAACGHYLGKVVRWVYRRGGKHCIRSASLNQSRLTKSGKMSQVKTKHNKVGNTDGCLPLMRLPDTMPADLDYDRYIDEANEILKQIGAV